MGGADAVGATYIIIQLIIALAPMVLLDHLHILRRRDQ